MLLVVYSYDNQDLQTARLYFRLEPATVRWQERGGVAGIPQVPGIVVGAVFFTREVCPGRLELKAAGLYDPAVHLFLPLPEGL